MSILSRLFRKRYKPIKEKFHNLELICKLQIDISQYPTIETVMRTLMKSVLVDMYWATDRVAIDSKLLYRYMIEKNNLMAQYDILYADIVAMKAEGGSTPKNTDGTVPTMN